MAARSRRITVRASGSRIRGAFTLLELLVVVAIIVTLVAIALPTYQRIQEEAHFSKDLSNLRQLGVAMRSYATDYDQYLPGQAWPSSLRLQHIADYSVFSRHSTGVRHRKIRRWHR